MIQEYFVGLPERFARGIIKFFYFWYAQSSKDFWNKEIEFLKGVERDIGVIINLKLITQPIFSDYTYMGRFLGPIFRLCRVIIGLIIMAVSIAAVIIVYLFWIILPPLAFLMIITNLLYVF